MARHAPTDDVLRNAFSIISSLTEEKLFSNACTIHEHCEGICESLSNDLELVFGAEVDFGDQIKGVPTKGNRGPRDETWLESQDPPFPPYEYDSINSEAGTIRLLRVNRAIYRADVLECELIVCNIPNIPAYDALSYCWGQPLFDHSLLCNGRRMNIGKSLHAALQRYRQAEDSEKQEYLWADAICVNQKDTSERSQQLSLMRQIYESAQTVRVDLGDAPVTGWSEGYNLCQLLDVAEQEAGLMRELQSTQGRDEITTERILERFGLPAMGDPPWIDLLRLFESPWWTRTWTVQEIIMARRARLCLGIFMVPWKQCWTVVQVIKRLQLTIPTESFPSFAATVGFLNYDKIRRLSQWNACARTHYAPLLAVMHAKDFDVSDPRDKIIGPLTLIDEKPAAGISPFLPDYSLSVGTFYQRFTIHLVELGLGHHFLDLAGLHRRLTGWHKTSTTQSNTLFADLRIVPAKPYHANGRTTFRRVLAPTGDGVNADTMIVNATILDGIKAMTGVLNVSGAKTWQQGVQIMSRTKLDWIREAQNLVFKSEGVIAATGRYSDLPEAFAWTTLGNGQYAGNKAREGKALIENPHDALRKLQAHLDQVAEGAPIRYLDSANPVLAVVSKQTTSVCNGRKFAVLEGGWIGLVPECANEGDEVWIIHGCPVPFLLRRTGTIMPDTGIQPRLLVGDAYVHGVMEGEALFGNI
ncbi:heterokaryon incompatibility protein-domain-containing protein [Exophiala viscosa]|uniref:heterokaryon incompatibility protein-domain-containing protein n=1 Tax=Exophiala viscosa TaxID=2486360 RepID=UPI0021999DDE|nr:heterokaryon incompatibility protein-domain-containing protein [Exophiala viscosa]